MNRIAMSVLALASFASVGLAQDARMSHVLMVQGEGGIHFSMKNTSPCGEYFLASGIASLLNKPQFIYFRYWTPAPAGQKSLQIGFAAGNKIALHLDQAVKKPTVTFGPDHLTMWISPADFEAARWCLQDALPTISASSK